MSDEHAFDRHGEADEKMAQQVLHDLGKEHSLDEGGDVLEPSSEPEAVVDEPIDTARADVTALDATGPEELDDAVVAEPERFIPVRVVEVEVALPSTIPVLVLEEIEWPKRFVRIPIGLPEGVAISYGLQELVTPKPLSHELMANIIGALGGVLEAVRITEVIGDAYFAEIVLTGPYGIRHLSARPSDAIALALRHRLVAPITVAERVFDLLYGPQNSGGLSPA